MKKIISSLLLVFIVAGSFAQTVQGSIQPVSAVSNTVIVMIKPSSTVTTRVSGVTVTLAIPVAVVNPNGDRPRPVATVDNTANTNITYYPVYDAIIQDIAGVPHYIYNILGDGNVSSAANDKTYTSGVDNELLRVTFGGIPITLSQLKLVNLPDGGTDPNPNSYFALSFLGTDVADVTAQFYAISGISTAVNDGNGYSGLSYALTTGFVPVPVKFIGFNVSKRDNNAVATWVVENENANTSHYEVERSLNGMSFSKLASVAVKNNGQPTNSYDFTDPNLSSLRSSGVIYYRIKQVDKDGKFSYTEIKSVRLDKGFGLSVYPNPVRENATVSLDLLEDTYVTISITDASGKLVKNIHTQSLKGLQTHQIDMNALASGSYMLKVKAGDETKIITVVKAK